MKTRLLIIIAFGMMVIMGFSMLPAYGLSCGIPLFTESYERHDLLLHGKLVEKKIPDFLSNKHSTLIFDTIKVYKGEFSSSFTIKADLSWDDFYREGEEYVLFADKDGSDYRRDLCVPNYLASSSIIKFLDDPSKDSEIYFLYNLLSGGELEDIDIRMNTYSDLNRAEIRNGTSNLGSYVFSSENYAMTWFGALQILIILVIVGIISYLIYRRTRK
jgi:hypothetical protein